jgi:nucleoside-diphosphate-sugar epimerase
MTAADRAEPADSGRPVALLLGGRGFIGSRLAPLLIARGYRIVCAEPTATTLGRLEPFGADVTLVNASTADRDALTELVARTNPACIFNLAYARGVDIATEMDIMCRGLWNTFDAARLAACRRVVFASSVRVYGAQSAHGEQTVLNESSPCHPLTRYGHAKLLGERLAADFNSNHAMHIAALRVPMVYGPGVREGAFGVCIPALAAASGAPTVLPYDPQAKLCLAHVDDVAHALAQLGDAWNSPPVHAVYELGGHALSYGEMAGIARTINPATCVTFAPSQTRLEHQFSYRLDGSRLHAEFGIIHRPVIDGYREIVDCIRVRHEDNKTLERSK